MRVVDYESIDTTRQPLPDRVDDPPSSPSLDHDNVPILCSARYDGWSCTNLAGDNGNHVARGTGEHIYARWREVDN